MSAKSAVSAKGLFFSTQAKGVVSSKTPQFSNSPIITALVKVLVDAGEGFGQVVTDYFIATGYSSHWRSYGSSLGSIWNQIVDIAGSRACAVHSPSNPSTHMQWRTFDHIYVCLFVCMFSEEERTSLFYENKINLNAPFQCNADFSSK
jgi:hypothetical protein